MDWRSRAKNCFKLDPGCLGWLTRVRPMCESVCESVSVFRTVCVSCVTRVWRSQGRTCSKLHLGSLSLPATHCARVQGPSAAQGISSPSCSSGPLSPTHTNVQACMGMPGLVLALVLKLMCLAFLLQLLCLRNACWIPWPLTSAAILVWRDAG